MKQRKGNGKKSTKAGNDMVSHNSSVGEAVAIDACISQWLQSHSTDDISPRDVIAPNADAQMDALLLKCLSSPRSSQKDIAKLIKGLSACKELQKMGILDSNFNLTDNYR